MTVHPYNVRRWSGAFSLAVLTSLGRPAAAADPPSDEAATEQRRSLAKSKYQQGAEAYAAGRFNDAVDLFLAADKLANSAILSFNIARAYEKLHDDAGALRWYRDYLRRSPNAANAEAVRALVADLASQLKQKGVQQLTVISSPTGATVNLDDQPVGVTPWTGELSPGAHRVLLILRGYADGQREIELPADTPTEMTVRMTQLLTLAPPPGAGTALASASLSPSSTPAGKKLGVLPWVVLGTGAAALGGSLAFELLRRNAENKAEQERTQVGYQDLLETMQGRRTAARVLVGAGGALVLTGGVMLLLDRPGSRHATSAGLLCIPGACGITARGQF